MLAGVLMLAGTVPPLPPPGAPVGNMAEWIRDGDYSVAEIGPQGGEAAFRVLFRPDGTVDDCTILRSSGNAAVEAKVCALARRRFRFRPSLGIDGQPKYRILERAANFRFEATAPPTLSPGPAYILQVDRLPGREPFLIVSVNVEVDDSGALIACAAPADTPRRLAGYARAACGALPDVWRAMPEKDGAGRPIGYIRDIKIAFERNAPAAGA